MPATASWITRRNHPDGTEACIRDTNINVWGLVARRQRGQDDEDILVAVQGLSAADLEAAAGAAVFGVEAEVVEHGADVEELGVVAEVAVAALEAAPEVHPAGVVVDQVGGAVPDQLGGLCGQLGVGDRHPCHGLPAGTH